MDDAALSARKTNEDTFSSGFLGDREDVGFDWARRSKRLLEEVRSGHIAARVTLISCFSIRNFAIT
jgi:hypothetical protein